MPNRILKESICYSEDIEKLTPEEEVFFYRLIVNCDDFGRTDARPKILKSRLYPLKENLISDDINRYLMKLYELKMIILYVNDDVMYLQLTKWEKHQQVRAKRSKYPASADKNSNVISYDIICNQMIAYVPENPNPNPNPNHSSSELSEPENGNEEVEEEKPEDPPLPENKFSDDRIELILSNELLTHIKQNHEHVKEPDLQKWAVHIDRMIRLDKRKPEDIKTIITWCQNDSFWKANILSTEKLREKFDALWIKMQEEKKPKKSRDKPSNRGGFEQRQHSDEYYDSFYENGGG